MCIRDRFYSQNAAFSERTRWRYRLRAGMVATFLDNFEAGFRLTSGEAVGTFGGDPISGNTTLRDNGAKKFVYLDLAYGRWTFINNKTLNGSLTIGKMENPFQMSDLMFDADYTPEGAGANVIYNINDVHSIR